jgi:hypothetical protein
LAVIQPPLRRPYLAMASWLYWEQEGVKRHKGGMAGETPFW